MIDPDSIADDDLCFAEEQEFEEQFEEDSALRQERKEADRAPSCALCTPEFYALPLHKRRAMIREWARDRM